MIQFVVRLTAVLLGLSSVLVIVGLFDAFLNWDIFSKRVESVLYGAFFSCITLAVASGGDWPRAPYHFGWSKWR